MGNGGALHWVEFIRHIDAALKKSVKK